MLLIVWGSSSSSQNAVSFIKKERWLTHGGGALVNEHTSKGRPAPSGFQVGRFQPHDLRLTQRYFVAKGADQCQVVFCLFAFSGKGKSSVCFVCKCQSLEMWSLMETSSGVLKLGQVWHVTPLYGNQTQRMLFFFNLCNAFRFLKVGRDWLVKTLLWKSNIENGLGFFFNLWKRPQVSWGGAGLACQNPYMENKPVHIFPHQPWSGILKPYKVKKGDWLSKQGLHLWVRGNLTPHQSKSLGAMHKHDDRCWSI